MQVCMVLNTGSPAICRPRSRARAGPAESADLRLHLLRTLAQALDGCLINAGHAGLHPLRGLHHLAHVHLAGLLHLGYIGLDQRSLFNDWLLHRLSLSIGLLTWLATHPGERPPRVHPLTSAAHRLAPRDSADGRACREQPSPPRTLFNDTCKQFPPPQTRSRLGAW